VGLSFQFALASETIQGLARDARWIVRQLRRAGTRTAERESSTTLTAA